MNSTRNSTFMAGWISRFIQTSPFWTFIWISCHICRKRTELTTRLFITCYLLSVKTWYYSRFNSLFVQSADALRESGVMEIRWKKLSLHFGVHIHWLNHVTNFRQFFHVQSMLLQICKQLIDIIIYFIKYKYFVTFIRMKERWYICYLTINN